LITVLAPQRPVADAIVRSLAEAGVVFYAHCTKQALGGYFKSSSDRRLIITQVFDEDRLVELIASINKNEDLNYLIFLGTRNDSEFTVLDCLNGATGRGRI
jgi:hypothetical protein